MEQVNVYLNKLIKIDELIKLANQWIQRYNHDRNHKEQIFLLLKAKNNLFIQSIERKNKQKM